MMGQGVHVKRWQVVQCGTSTRGLTWAELETARVRMKRYGLVEGRDFVVQAVPDRRRGMNADRSGQLVLPGF